MIIRVNGYELNVNKNQDVYVGGATNGQMFINWADLDSSEKAKLEEIEAQAFNLIRQLEQVLIPSKN
ncbi:MAG: hypothetical protein U9Q05_07370 [Thermodesulfobacteriota bacterium]|nr:hypothetical protein [Thermodesulfobacteriota bacterium]